MKFASFDLEIANDFPEEGSWNKNLGITCAAVAMEKEDSWDIPMWYNSPKITQEQAIALVEYLMGLTSEGYSIVTWNGAAFDFRVLADVSGMYRECAALAMSHLDMMLWVTFQKGFYLGLEAALKGQGLVGKRKFVTLKDGSILQNMSGKLAPELWKAGETKAVLSYLEDDVVEPLKLVKIINITKHLHWTSKRGKPMVVPINRMWTVDECFHLPKPDTSWMKNPPRREQFIEWMQEYKNEDG